MKKNSKIFVAGHNGMVGSAIVRNLVNLGYQNLVLKNRHDLNLLNQKDVLEFFEFEKPEYVFIAAAKVGGILANDKYRADFIYQNLTIQNNIIHSSHLNKIKKLIFLGSACVYPKFSEQPIKEESLLSGYLEPTNDPYSIAKISGIKMCESYYKQYGSNFISVMPNNLYGPNDNFNLETSHVLPALINKIHNAKLCKKRKIEVWGTGKPMREFLFVEDLADACVFLMINLKASDLYGLNISHINIGTGDEISIINLTEKIKKIIGYEGNTFFNKSFPDGMPRKLVDSSRLKRLGWSAKTSLDNGLKITYDWYLKKIMN